MLNQSTNKKFNKPLIIITTAFVMVFLFVLGFAITYAAYGGIATGSIDPVIIASIDVDVTYTLDFDDVVLPNTTYTGSNYTLAIKNSGNSGPIYIKVKVDNVHAENMDYLLASESLWAKGGENNNEYYYLSTLNSGSTQSFLAGVKTLNNFTNEIAGQTLDIKFTVYAIQSQYGAVKEDSSWWTYAPSAFKTFVG